MAPKNLDIEGISEIAKGKYKHLHVDGEGIVKGDIECKTIDVDGSIKFTSDCECKRILVDGEIYLVGTLTAEDVDINFAPNSYIHKIKAPLIHLEPRKSKKQETILKVDKIIGDDITLENVHVKSVKGNQVTINKGCIIESLVCQRLEKLSKQSHIQMIQQGVTL